MASVHVASACPVQLVDQKRATYSPANTCVFLYVFVVHSFQVQVHVGNMYARATNAAAGYLGSDR